MSAPLIATARSARRSSAAVALGAGFGFALERAGLGSARKLSGSSTAATSR